MARINFLANDFVALINKTSIDGTDFISKMIYLPHSQRPSLTFYVKGNHASCSANITFKFAAYDALRGIWDTVDCINDGSGIAVAMSGMSVVQKTILLSPDMRQLNCFQFRTQKQQRDIRQP